MRTVSRVGCRALERDAGCDQYVPDGFQAHVRPGDRYPSLDCVVTVDGADIPNLRVLES